MKATEQIKALESRNRCTCWDCLRSRGITPPLNARHRHRIYPTRTVAQGVGYDFAKKIGRSEDA